MGEGLQRPSPGQGQEKLDETDRFRSPLLSPRSLQASLRMGSQDSGSPKATTRIFRESSAESFSLMTGCPFTLEKLSQGRKGCRCLPTPPWSRSANRRACVALSGRASCQGPGASGAFELCQLWLPECSAL